MGLIKQIEIIEKGRNILANTQRASQQFANSANSLMAELGAFDATLPDAGLDADTLTEIGTLKAQTIAGVQAQLTAIQTALSNL